MELKVKHSIRNVKKFRPPSELKLMELEGTSKFIQYTTFGINLMLDCGADEAMKSIETEKTTNISPTATLRNKKLMLYQNVLLLNVKV